MEIPLVVIMAGVVVRNLMLSNPMNQKQSWEETLENIIRGILSRYEDKFNFDFKSAERSWGKKAGMENFLREEFSSAIKQAIQTREREISEESNK